MKRYIALLSLLLLLAGSTAIAQEFVPAEVSVTSEKVKLNGKVYYAHQVLERQTLYGIAKAYGVTEEDLYQANPSLRETGLKKDSILLVPVEKPAQKVEESTSSPQAQGYKEHTVKWYEDIDDVARRYGVTAKDIMDFNGLKSRKLTTRQVLRIPVKDAPATQTPETPDAPAAPQADTPEVTTVEADTLSHPETLVENPLYGVEEVSDSTLLAARTRDAVDFSLLLPLNAGNGTSELNMDFYSGVLMALKDLEAEGLKVQMHVYDLYAGMPDVDVLCRGDFVLGPVASRDIEAVLTRLEGRIPVISPLDQKAASLSTGYNNFIQAPAGADNQYEDLGAWVQEDLAEEDKLIYISEKNASSIQAAIGIRSALARRELTYDILTYGMSEGRSIPETLPGLMKKGVVNRVVVASESEPFVGDVVRNLGMMLGKGFDVVMYAPSKVRTFDTIDGSALHDLSAHISTSYHVNYSSAQVERFVQTYRALFRTEPSQFAFQGYDTARYFVLRVARYGEAWPNKLGMERSRGLHTDFLFDADENNNRHNVAVRRIVYQKDYSTSLLH